VIIQTGHCNAAKRIAQRSDGLHGLVFTNSGKPKVCFWKSEASVETHDLSADLNLAQPCMEFVDDRFIISSIGTSGGPVRVVELDVATRTIQHSFTFGLESSRNGASCRLAGGALFAHFRDLGSIDVWFRRPSIPVPNPQPLWVSLTVPFPFPLPAFDMSMIEGPDGLAWLFIARDSAQTVGLIRFKVTPDGNIVVVDSNPDFIPRHTGCSINGEQPHIVAMRDGNSIILGYQDENHGFCQCNGVTTVTSKAQLIVCVAQDKSFSLVGKLDWESFHVYYPMTLVWPRPDGFYFIAPYAITSNCERGWKTGIVQNGVTRIASSDPGGDVLSYSESGWILFERVMEATPWFSEYDLMRYQFQPALKIRQQGKDVIVSWPSTGLADQLQFSSDLKTWQDVPGAISSPVTISNSKPHQFFRLK
jgi:hypothetical protein